MNMDDERQRSVNASIERLRRRVKRLKDNDVDERILDLASILLGILDLLGDEL